MFHVGQLVVCVDDNPHPARNPVSGIARGLIYTIRAVLEDRGETGVLLAEVRLPPYPHGGEFGFLARRFRPVRKTDISVLRDVVESVRNRTLVPAEITTKTALGCNPRGNDFAKYTADQPCKALPVLVKMLLVPRHGSNHADGAGSCHRTGSSVP